MKTNSSNRRALLSVFAVVLTTLATALNATAAATPLTAQVVARPLTPGDKTVYKLASTMEVSGGLNVVGIGAPLYLEAEVNIAIPASNITSVTWSVTNAPLGSVATFTNSPLGTNIPVYEVADRALYQVAGRTLFRPDLTGQYTVIASITTSGGSGNTNVSWTFSAGTYMGLTTCMLCHSGGAIAQDKFHPWSQTAHSMIFSNGINGYLGSYSINCLSCHTVGYDTTASAVNGGFDDVMKSTGWLFPTVLTNSNWAAMPSALQNLGNIQCENCHGPGSEHAFALGNTNVSNWPRLAVTVNSGDCNQCHDAPTHHIYGTEWYASAHANADTTARVPSGSPSRAVCIRCHTSTGFISFWNGTMGPAATTNTTFSALACQTCHEPHGETMPTNNPHLLRVLGSVNMPDGTVVTNAGLGAICLECHHNRNGSATNQIVNYPKGLNTWVGGSSFGPHDGPQGDLIEGVNAFTYGQNIPSAAHREVVTDLCVGCHMQPLSSSDPGLYLAGGHTFNMSYSVVTNGVTNVVDKTDVCVQCHGKITTFDLPRGDLNGDGIIEGCQTEVQHLLDKLSTLLPPNNSIKSSLSITTNWSQQQLKAGYNWQFVANDGSRGVHNLPFAAGLLKASIADLTGDANGDGLPDAWQILYFGAGFGTNALAGPNASPAGDGIPNWLKCGLGLNPFVAGVTLPDSVILANDVNSSSGDNTIRIYTAAEVNFDTVAGKTYYIDAMSVLGSGWTRIASINATNTGSMSYLTPTRKNIQQYYRVSHSP